MLEKNNNILCVVKHTILMFKCMKKKDKAIGYRVLFINHSYIGVKKKKML
jgi:hypothetical protein